MHVREREVSGFEDSFNCCRVLEGERLEREIEIINVRVDGSFLLGSVSIKFILLKLKAL